MYEYWVNNYDFLKWLYGCHESAAKAVEINHNFKKGINMTDPILYLSMILGLTGVYVLISSFGDDDDDSNDDGERYIYNLEYVKVGK